MTPIAAMVEQMMSAGISADIIVLAVRTAEEASAEVLRNSADITTSDDQAERRRAADRDRKAAARLRNSADIPDPHTLSFLEETIKEGSRKEDTNTRDDWPPDAFDHFWTRYPHKVGKHDAKLKFKRARQSGVKWSDFIAGLDRYIAGKPIDRAWLNPSTYLHQRRWEDQPATNGTAAPTDCESYIAVIGSDEWEAWLAHTRQNGPKFVLSQMETIENIGTGKMSFRSRWPPGFTPPAPFPENHEIH